MQQSRSGVNLWSEMSLSCSIEENVSGLYASAASDIIGLDNFGLNMDHPVRNAKSGYLICPKFLRGPPLNFGQDLEISPSKLVRIYSWAHP